MESVTVTFNLEALAELIHHAYANTSASAELAKLAFEVNQALPARIRKDIHRLRPVLAPFLHAGTFKGLRG